jgi:hypothetical protein
MQVRFLRRTLCIAAGIALAASLARTANGNDLVEAQKEDGRLIGNSFA